MIQKKEHVERILYLPNRPETGDRKVFCPSLDYILTRPYRTQPGFWNKVDISDVEDDDNFFWYQLTADPATVMDIPMWMARMNTYSFFSISPTFSEQYLPNGFSYPAFNEEQAYRIMTMLLSPYMDTNRIVMDRNSRPTKILDFEIVLPKAKLVYRSFRDRAFFLLDFYLFHSYLLGLEPVWENNVFEPTSFPAYTHRLPDIDLPFAGISKL